MTGSTPEHVFFGQNGVTVTNARFVVPSHTYAMANITSVRFFTETPPITPSIVCFLVGLLAIPAQGNIWAVGLPLLVGGILLKIRRPTHHVVLSVASGETRALQSRDKSFIAAVIHALNEAIISRG